MEKKDLFDFVKKFNFLNSIPIEVVIEGLKTLPQKDLELFMLLVNYKNGKDFSEKLFNGEI